MKAAAEVQDTLDDLDIAADEFVSMGDDEFVSMGDFGAFVSGWCALLGAPSRSVQEIVAELLDFPLIYQEPSIWHMAKARDLIHGLESRGFTIERKVS